ncbi:TPA: hypothetical protein N0F65_003088 [Lagenidium giganteum]|uniref:Uncharacterized protein n=1 Tax=Lagenidium giganteum TaxID=4803 RepID=A0AAV2YNM5_9STRA|nr:TPA: hypothetical protein N0F65_003088 [Lagenidium giganteum]
MPSFSPAANDTTTVRCVASWAHTQQQVLYMLATLLGLVCFASVWTVMSRRQRRRLADNQIGFSLRLRRWARTSRTAAIITRPVQLVTSFCIVAIIASRCSSYQVLSSTYHLITFLYLFCIADDVVRFLAARYKVLFCFAPLTLLELLCLVSHFQVGYGSVIRDDNGAPTRSWLDFSVMRVVFVLRSYLDMEKHIPRSTRGVMILRVGIKILLLICFGASVMFFLETLGEMPFFIDNGFAHLYSCSDTGDITHIKSANCTDETWSVMYSFYFTVVTLGTVGYGDNAPKTVLSRLLVILFIVMGVILFSMEIENLISVYKLKQIGNPPYKPKPESRHVLIMGNPSFSQLTAILRELFHEDHAAVTDSESGRLHAVVLGERHSKFTSSLVAKLEGDPLFAARVTYVAGNPTRTEDLERALARESEAAFVFPDKLSDDPANEDAMNIMRVLSIRRHCGPNYRCLVMVLRPESSRHVIAAGVDKDDVICEHIAKMGALSQSTTARGLSTMLANLGSSLSIDCNPEDPTNKNSSPSLTLFNTMRGTRNGIDVGDMQYPALNQTFLNAAPLSRSWKRQYYEGAAKEMYLVRLSREYAGLTFAKASRKIFKKTHGSIVLIAVEMTLSAAEDPDSPFVTDSRVLLNPGTSLIMEEWMQCYVIADDLQDVIEKICPEYHKDRPRPYSPDTTPSEILQPLAETFMMSPNNKNGNDATMGDEGFTNVTAYSQMATPVASSRRKMPTIKVARSERNQVTSEQVQLDQALESVAFHYHDDHGTMIGERQSIPGLANIESRSLRALATGNARELGPPPLEVLLHPQHVVVCSFLGEESLASLLWFVAPLRSPHARHHPPITILDASEPTRALLQLLSPYKDVYYVRGSPLVYADLQRAGAKAAACVIVLGKRAKSSVLKTFGAEDDIESSIVDAEAIFTTMLVELKMDFSKIFTITELSDESNSKFMGMSYHLKHHDHADMSGTLNVNKQAAEDMEPTLWDYILMNDTPVQKSERAIFGVPLFMSGRLLHPEFCENMLVQTYFNPTIHKIVRQLGGGPSCTGYVHMFSIPKALRGDDIDGLNFKYKDVFKYFAQSTYSGICLGLYRWSTQNMQNGTKLELPIVITTPDAYLEIAKRDRVYVLIGVHTLARAATRIQRFLQRRRFCIPQKQRPSARSVPRRSVSTPPPPPPQGSPSSWPTYSRSSIARYLEPRGSLTGEDTVVGKDRRSLIAKESSMSFKSYLSVASAAGAIAVVAVVMNAYLQGKCRSEQQLMNDLTKLIAAKDYTSKKMSELMKELGYFYVFPVFTRIPHTVLKDLSVLLGNLKDKKEDLRIAKLALCFLSRLIDQFELFHHNGQLQGSRRTQSFEISTTMASNLLKVLEVAELSHPSVPRQVTCVKLYAHLCRTFHKEDSLLLRLRPMIQKSPVWNVLAGDKKTKASVMGKKDYLAQVAVLGGAFHSVRFYVPIDEQASLLENLCQAAFLPNCSASRHAAATLLALFEHSRDLARQVVEVFESFVLKFCPPSLLVGDQLATHHLLRLAGQISRLPVATNDGSTSKQSSTKAMPPPAPAAPQDNLLDFSFDTGSSTAPSGPSPPPSPVARHQQRIQGLTISAALSNRLREWLLDVLCGPEMQTTPKSVLLVAVEEVVKDANAESCFMRTRGNVCVFEIVSGVLLKMFATKEPTNPKDKQAVAAAANTPSVENTNVVLLHRICRAAQFTAEALDGAVLQLTASAHQPQYLDRITDRIIEATAHANEFVARESLCALVWLLPRKQIASTTGGWEVLLQRLLELRVAPELRVMVAEAFYHRAVTNPSLHHESIDAEMLRKCLRVTLVWFQTWPCAWHAEMLVRIWQTALRKGRAAMGDDVFASIATVLDFQHASARDSTELVQQTTLEFLGRMGAGYAVATPAYFRSLVLRLTKAMLVESMVSRRLAVKALAQLRQEAQQQGKMDMVHHVTTLFQHLMQAAPEAATTAPTGDVLLATAVQSASTKELLGIQDLLAKALEPRAAPVAPLPMSGAAQTQFGVPAVASGLQDLF